MRKWILFTLTPFLFSIGSAALAENSGVGAVTLADCGTYQLIQFDGDYRSASIVLRPFYQTDGLQDISLTPQLRPLGYTGVTTVNYAAPAVDHLGNIVVVARFRHQAWSYEMFFERDGITSKPTACETVKNDAKDDAEKKESPKNNWDWLNLSHKS